MDKMNGGFAPDLGLEYVSRFEESAVALPAHSETPLTGTRIRQRVDDLFHTGSLDETLRRFAQPRVSDPAMLAPARFESLVRDSGAALRALAERDGDESLALAGALLDQELQLRTLLASYRNLLIKA